jgi:hypothetical protein
MSGELILAIGCGAVLIVSGIIAYVWTRRSYASAKTGPEKSADNVTEEAN